MDYSAPADVVKPPCSLASSAEGNWILERSGFSVVSQAPKVLVFLEGELATCHRRSPCTESLAFAKRWCTLAGYSACAPKRSRKDFGFYCNSWICPPRIDWWRTLGKNEVFNFRILSLQIVYETEIIHLKALWLCEPSWNKHTMPKCLN